MTEYILFRIKTVYWYGQFRDGHILYWTRTKKSIIEALEAVMEFSAKDHDVISTSLSTYIKENNATILYRSPSPITKLANPELFI